MKSTTAFALVASLLPFAMAMPYNMEHAERDADADAAYEVDWVTDVKVATVYTQITEYWTGEPAATTTYAAPSTSSAVLVETTSAPARNRQHNGNGRGRRSTIEYTIQTTTTSEAAPTSTSSVDPPPPPPETTSSSTWVAPVPTTFVTLAPPQQASISTSSSAPAPVSSDTSTGQLNTYGLDLGPADFADAPKFTPSGYSTEGSASLQGDSFKQGILQSANAWRAKWGAGPFTWNDSLATVSQSILDNKGCDPKTVQHQGASNIAWATHLTPIGANGMWGGEAAAWRVSRRNGTDPPKSMIEDNEVGHFTQLVWKSATQVGCAQKVCSDDGSWIAISCNYDEGNGYFPWEANYEDSYGRKGSGAKNVNNLPTY